MIKEKEGYNRGNIVNDYCSSAISLMYKDDKSDIISVTGQRQGIKKN